jgi:predicted transcriptional regulator
MEMSTMGRKVNEQHVFLAQKIIQENDGKVRLADIAKKTGLHPQAVSRALTFMQDVADTLLQEDDKGFLGIFKK